MERDSECPHLAHENDGGMGDQSIAIPITEFFGQFQVMFGHLNPSGANVQILLMAIERAGTWESEAVRDAVRNGEFKDTVMGDIKFDETGLAVTESTANQWWNGKQMLVHPPVEGGYKLKMMPPLG